MVAEFWHKKGTIQAVLGKSDFEMGYETVTKGRRQKNRAEPPTSGFTFYVAVPADRDAEPVRSEIEVPKYGFLPIAPKTIISGFRPDCRKNILYALSRAEV